MMGYKEIKFARNCLLCTFLILITNHNILKIVANSQTNPCLVLKLPLCSINPNFGTNRGSATKRPIQEQPRRQEGNRLAPSKQSSSSQTKEDLAVSALLDKFLKSTQSDTAVKSSPPSDQPLPPIPTTVSLSGKVRSDRRCGTEFPLEDGKPSQCDPNSQNYCCSKWGYCGPGAEHCDCPECVDYRNENSPDTPEFIGKFRTDRRCGQEFPLPDGGPSECDPTGANHCCSKWGYCGPDAEHCECEECVDYQRADVKVLTAFGGKVRSDRRCGKEFPLQDGSPSECDSTSQNPCCSKWGFCGPDAEHCSCTGCVDYRSQEQRGKDDFIGNVRKDRRCGPEFPLPGTDGLPSECDPNSENFCCSKWGYCGGDGEHCDCPECVIYKRKVTSTEESFSVPTVPSVPSRRRRPNTRVGIRRRTTTTTTTKRPKNFNQYEEYVYYDY